MYTALQLARKYAGYYWQGLNSKGHGVHSPFVFDFIKKVKNDRKQYHCYREIERLRKTLLQDKGEIEVQDFGAGSTIIKTNRRSIFKMAASSLKPKRFAQLLYRVTQYYKPQTIVELGTSFGITSSYLARGNPGAILYTLEGSPSIAHVAKRNFETQKIKNIKLVEGDFNLTLEPLLAALPSVDLAFVDGNHKKEPTLRYFEQLLAKKTEKSIFIFDDIHWSAEMEQAWDKIKIHDAVTLSIDLFFIGIVFFRKDFKAKQHFTLRF